MKIACLQFDPQIRKVQDNIQKADEILENYLGIEDVQGKVDVLVLPELAFTGYVFASKETIRPFLEPTTSGITTQWAQSTSRRLRCYTIVGYPELAVDYQPPTNAPWRPQVSDPFSETPIEHDDDEDKIQQHSFNACVVTSPDGEVVMNYRKTFLYSTDETWASEGSSFGTLTLTFPTPGFSSNQSATTPLIKSVKVALGICMDLNPYQFRAPFNAYEFANHVLSSGAQLAIIPMAWETRDYFTDSQLKSNPEMRHSSTLRYWCTRLEPLFGYNDKREEDSDQDDDDEAGANTPTETEDEDGGADPWVNIPQAKGSKRNMKEQDRVVVMTCNRAGRENGVLFVGTSSIITLKKKDEKRVGSIEKLEALGMAEERLLVVEVDL
ncbi:Carbon-nitrogen hydrolase [Orbilia ellipsospora]|uniref:Carbon-nitrogen hydrolase n=1 Tax=Orbilia ellipsospora TaxID=2528407 RepID=A0AAV9XLQ3_9PEZI